MELLETRCRISYSREKSFENNCCSLISGSPLHFHDHTSMSLSYSLLHPLAETIDGMFLGLHVLSQLLQECLEHKQAFTDWILQVTHWLQPMPINKQELFTYHMIWWLFLHEELICFLACMYDHGTDPYLGHVIPCKLECCKENWIL